VLVGNLQRSERPRAEVRLAPAQLIDTDGAHPVIAAAPRAVGDRGQAPELRLVPGDQQPARPLERDADLLGIAEGDGERNVDVVLTARIITPACDIGKMTAREVGQEGEASG
jgi:hypothetical protein